MRKNAIWIVISVLMAAVLVLSSCASDTTEPTTPETPTVDPNAPIYGGKLTLVAADPTGWDPALIMYNQQPALKLAAETLGSLDWYKGPQGTNEWTFTSSWAECPEDIKKGLLAERWELVDQTHAIYYVRQGVMWQDRPGVHEAREVTADDLVFSINRILAEPANYWAGVTGTPDHASTIDRYTFEVIFTMPEPRMYAHLFLMLYSHVAPDVIEEYGSMEDWQTVTGTGPFILTDYVEDSAITYEKNPNWYMKDSEGRSLPYIDELELLVIPDVSTRIAAMRTGQIDTLAGYNMVGYEDSTSLMETNPELMYEKIPHPNAIDMELDMKAPPFGPTDDPDAYKVRLAASIAIDREGIINEYYQGDAIPWASQMSEVYMGRPPMDVLLFENLPESIAKFHDYDPERARELLAEAGYPNGFKTVITVATYEADYYALIKSYWDAVGIETELNVV